MRHIYSGSVIDQFERVKRFLRRIQSEEGNSIDYDDDLISFFMHCHSLKDWARNDPDSHITKKEAECLISNNIELEICASTANRSKHLKLYDTGDRMDAKITGRRETIDLNQGISIPGHIITLEDGTEYEALVVAERAVRIWEKFLQDKGLIP
jgi:hypothetical protein